MEFTKFVEWGFLGLISATLGFSVSYLRVISQSISRLNVQVGEILVHSAWHKEKIDNHEVRITKLEERKH